MKLTKLLLFCVFVVSGSLASMAQDIRKTAISKDKIVVESSDNCPLAPFYGKKLHVAWHKKNNIKIGHNGSDYVIFFRDGSYEQSWSGVASKGSWKWQERDNKVDINCVGTNTYLIESTSSEKVVLTKPNEYLSLYLTN